MPLQYPPGHTSTTPVALVLTLRVTFRVYAAAFYSTVATSILFPSKNAILIRVYPCVGLLSNLVCQPTLRSKDLLISASDLIMPFRMQWEIKNMTRPLTVDVSPFIHCHQHQQLAI